MNLAPEDALRLNVLLANQPEAIRIHESSMTVFGLTAGGEVQLRLNPTCRDDQYLKRVRELLSGHVLGSPGGYPVYLQRWTRMGQMRDQSLEQLLLLGEPEAVVAAVCAPGLSDELARRAWWAMEDAENARRMLAREPVAGGAMGPVLARYLAEHLAFETEPDKMMETVRLILQPGLVDAAMRAELWKKAQRKTAYYVGFMAALPDDLPEQPAPHPALAEQGDYLHTAAAAGDALALQLLRTYAPAGQAYLATALRVLHKPPNQDVVITLLDILAGQFAGVRPEGAVDLTLAELVEEADAWLGERAPAALRPAARAARVLSGVGYGVVRPVLSGTTAIGSLMRRKLEPVLAPLIAEIAVLRGGSPRD